MKIIFSSFFIWNHFDAQRINTNFLLSVAYLFFKKSFFILMNSFGDKSYTTIVDFVERYYFIVHIFFIWNHFGIQIMFGSKIWRIFSL
jgi:hypothetical protein